MARSVNSLSIYKGRYQRVLGKAFNTRGKLTPKKFLLGTDPQKAKLANARLERLWAEVVAEHERTLDFVQGTDIQLLDHNEITGVPTIPNDPYARRNLNVGPHWRPSSLMLAEAIRKDQRSVAVPALPGEDGETYFHRLTWILRRTFTAIELVPADVQLYDKARMQVQVESAVHRARAENLAELAAIQTPDSDQTLHEAIEAYAASRPTVKESGRIEAANARRLKDDQRDLPLSRLGMEALQALGDYWRGRPASKANGKPISLYTVKNHLDTARRFVRWLDRHEGFSYEPPRHWEETLKVDLRRLRTQDETAALARGVSVWTLDELTLLYRHADDLSRLLILLGLNLGAAQAEICTLRIGEIERDGQSARVKRIRHKSGVYGEFALWPQTLTAIDWCLDQRRRQKGADDPVLITAKGQPWSRQLIANRWKRLVDHTAANHPALRRLSFKILRKTAAQWVRQQGGGEIMGVFLCHGQPVATDALADVYSNRPFDRVAVALDAVAKQLRPMFEAAPDAFS